MTCGPIETSPEASQPVSNRMVEEVVRSIGVVSNFEDHIANRQAAATQSDPPLIKDIRSLIEPYVNLSVREKDQGIKDTSDQLISIGWEVNLVVQEQFKTSSNIIVSLRKTRCAQLLNFNVKYSREWGHSGGKLVSDRLVSGGQGGGALLVGTARGQPSCSTVHGTVQPTHYMLSPDLNPPVSSAMVGVCFHFCACRQVPPAQPPRFDFYLNAKLGTVAIDFSGVI
ncbi:hypothetical protein EDC04DRAFT_3090958 [Pisolithus marmoratus]|nr:hypothetical protein EDC04DRAFT_2607711 [Pisolithus marmoratus]KAI6038167.1 hypothetical protein EDC04DRAFT_3090958 [Pisolithus marmoratus]